MKRDSIKTRSVPALDRSLAILELLAASRDGLALPAIARKLGFPKTNVYRLLITLERHRSVHRGSQTERYRLGSRLLGLGDRSRECPPLRQAALPHLRGLARRTGLTSHLGILDCGQAVLMETVEPAGVFHPATRPPAKRLDLHSTAIGKALIARLPEKDLARLMRETGMPRHNENTIRSLRKLKDCLARSLAAGYFLDDEEDEIGYRSIGAPILDEGREVLAAVAVSGSTAQVREDNSPALAEHLMRAAEAIADAFAGIREK